MKKIMTGFILILLFVTSGTVSAERLENPAVDDGYAAVGEALMKAKQKDWNGIKEAAVAFSIFSNSLHGDSKHESEINEIKAKAALLEKEIDNHESWNAIKHTLMEASHAVRQYDDALHPVDKNKERAKLSVLLPIAKRLDTALKEKDMKKAASVYDELNRTWKKNEAIVRTDSVVSYGEVETGLAFMRIGFEQQPVNVEQIQSGNDDFVQAVNAFMAGEKDGQAKQKYELADAIALLEKSEAAVAKSQSANAIKPLQELIKIWPSVEGKVRIKDPALYNDVENKIPAAIGKLQSERPRYDEVASTLKDLIDRLKLLDTNTAYNFADAMLILLREGIEAILVVAGLAAFLKRANKGVGVKWVWGGAVAGIIASLLLAVVLVIFFANAAGAQNREKMEGIIGIVAVVLMLSIGAWLHKRSNILNWNSYFERSMGKAVATGSLFTIASLSFLAIFREGAETIVFYIGMAPAIELQQLLLGIGIALVILIVAGFAMIRFSSKIPLRPFFVAAAWLIYLLAFKMIGASIHALQIADMIPVHMADAIPLIQWIGVYPTMETIVPQLCLIILICLTSMQMKWKARRTVKI